MVKKRPKSRPVRVSGATGTPRYSSASESVDDEIYAALTSAMSVPPVLKVCRLCETKDGPFLNIFDADKVTAKRIDEVLPFTVAENDELPHKICFRCSAKVEELYEFILKCVKTQDNLRTATGKKGPLVTKCKNTSRLQWEKHLDKKCISNDDICNALVRNAMANIKSLSLNAAPKEEKLEKPLSLHPSPAPTNKKMRNTIEPSWKNEKEVSVIKNNYQSDEESEEEQEKVTLKQVKLSIEKCDNRVNRSTRSSIINKQPDPTPVPVATSEPKKIKQYPARTQPGKTRSPVNNKDATETPKQINATNNVDKPIEPPKVSEAPPPPINIMDHVSTIKVNSVGTLFLCKLCNRNFLKKEVVLAHGCAKNNVPKDKFLHNMPPRDIPKPPVTVKYIIMDKDFKKTVENRSSVLESRPVMENKPLETKSTSQPAIKVNVPVQPEIKPKPKPKAGPASKVQQFLRQTEVQQPAPPPAQPPPVQEQPAIPSLQFPTIPSLNSRYKLVPGPNNTFTLVEDSAAQLQMSAPTLQYQMSAPTPQFQMPVPTPQFQMAATPQLQMSMPTQQYQIAPQTSQYQTSPPINQFQMTSQNQFQMTAAAQQFQTPTPQPPIKNPGPKSKSKKRKMDSQPASQYNAIVPDNEPHEVIDLEESILPEPQAVEQPYPVGLFTTPHHSAAFGAPSIPKPNVTTPAIKKQSYTIVQTGNPSKLLISTKPQPVVEEQQKKKSKKKPEVDENSQSKDGGYFTFINVDPLVQPSYVLPTDNIIQESQISTSTPASKAVVDKEKEKYSCNMCDETFSREKKLLAHIQSHFNQMDEEDQMRKEKSGPSSKKRSRKT